MERICHPFRTQFASLLYLTVIQILYLSYYATKELLRVFKRICKRDLLAQSTIIINKLNITITNLINN